MSSSRNKDYYYYYYYCCCCCCCCWVLTPAATGDLELGSSDSKSSNESSNLFSILAFFRFSFFFFQNKPGIWILLILPRVLGFFHLLGTISKALTTMDTRLLPLCSRMFSFFFKPVDICFIYLLINFFAFFHFYSVVCRYSNIQLSKKKKKNSYFFYSLSRSCLLAWTRWFV